MPYGTTYEISSPAALGDAVRRIGIQLVSEADLLLDGIDADGAVDAIHESRKRCKEVRGLVRLVRPGLGDRYRRINTACRDAARRLSPFRDAHALSDTFDHFVRGRSDGLPVDAVAFVIDELRRRSDASTESVSGESDEVSRARALLRDARDEIEGIDADELTDAGWDVVGDGIAKTYGRGRDALDETLDDPTPENHHELRKRAKYTWYHLQLVERSARAVLSPLESVFHDLADGLGDAHDLAVLRDQLVVDLPSFGDDASVAAVLMALDDCRRDLESRGIALARRLYAESPKAFTRRLGAYWDVWAESGDEPGVGEIGDLVDDDGSFRRRFVIGSA